MRALLAAVAGVLSVVGAGSSGPGVQTLYRVGGPITAFAQDGSLLAWFAPAKGGCNAVHVVSLGGATVTLPKPGTDNVTCRWSPGKAGVQLAVSAGAGNALWTLPERAQVEFDYVVGATVRQPRERRFYQLAHTRAGAGLWLGGIAGDGGTLLYSTVTVGYVNQVACLSGGSCARRIRGGGVHRVVGRHDPLIKRTKATLRIAAADGRMALVRAAAVDRRGIPVANARLPVEIRDVRTGGLVARVAPHGIPLGLALSPHVLALLTHTPSGKRLSWFDARSGRRLGTIRVPRGTSRDVAVNDQMAIYRTGRVVRAVDLASRRVRRLVKTDALPVGLSIEGSRLAWAETVGGRGRIRAIFVRGRG